MGIVAGDKIEAEYIYGRAGYVSVRAGNGKKATVIMSGASNGVYMIVIHMATATVCGGIYMVHHETGGWHGNWIQTMGTPANNMSITLSEGKIIISNKNTGVMIKALIFSTSKFHFIDDDPNQSSDVRTDLECARTGDLIRSRDLLNTKHSKNITANTTYTIALANFAQTPKFFFTAQGSSTSANYSYGMIWHTSDGWHISEFVKNGKVPTYSISGTNLTITAPSDVVARFSWFEVL